MWGKKDSEYDSKVEIQGERERVREREFMDPGPFLGIDPGVLNISSSSTK